MPRFSDTTPRPIRLRHRIAGLLLACAAALFGGCAFFGGGGPRDFIEVADIAQVPESDPVTLTEARVKGDSLLFTASYGGGCREHVFTLYAMRGPASTSTVLLYVHHHANHDPCRAIVAETVGFSLLGLKKDLRVNGDAVLQSAPGTDPAFTLSY